DVDAAIAGDPEEPWRDGFALVESPQVAVQLDEGLLGDVGRVVGLAEHAQTEVVHRCLVASHERFERRWVMAPSGQQLLAFKSQRIRWSGVECPSVHRQRPGNAKSMCEDSYGHVFSCNTALVHSAL